MKNYMLDDLIESVNKQKHLWESVLQNTRDILS